MATRSLTRLTTGASIVLDADRTNSPMFEGLEEFFGLHAKFFRELVHMHLGHASINPQPTDTRAHLPAAACRNSMEQFLEIKSSRQKPGCSCSQSRPWRAVSESYWIAVSLVAGRELSNGVEGVRCRRRVVRGSGGGSVISGFRPNGTGWADAQNLDDPPTRGLQLINQLLGVALCQRMIVGRRSAAQNLPALRHGVRAAFPHLGVLQILFGLRTARIVSCRSRKHLACGAYALRVLPKLRLLLEENLLAAVRELQRAPEAANVFAAWARRRETKP